MPTSPKELNLELEGYHLSIRKSSAGFPIVLIHIWHPYARYLLDSLPSNTYQIITFDIPGYYSKVPGKLITNLPDLNRLLENLFDHLGFKKVDLVGQCLGGVVALNFASHHPERVRNLIVVTPPLLCYKPKVRRVLKAVFSFPEKNQTAQFLTSHLIIKRQILREITRLFGGYKDLVDVFAQETGLITQTDFNPQVFFGIFSSAFKLNFWDMVKGVKARTLFVSGEKDSLAGNRDLEKLVKTMKNASYKIIPQAKHAVVIKNTEDFNEIVLSFLSPPAP